MSLIKSVRETVKKYNLLEKNDRVVIGVSGGPDSLALLFILYSLRKELNLRLYIAHLDHRIRKDSHKDAKFVKALAGKLKIPFYAMAVNLRRSAGKSSIEELAREERFKFLFRVARGVKAAKIALGHNQDDQAETVLMRLIRGSGLSGLASILPKRKIAKHIVIRPMIQTTRKSINSYLKRKKVNARIDATNRSSLYLRNRIRNNLFPLLIKNYNPNIKEVLANSAQVIASDYDFLEQAARKEFMSLKRAFLIKIQGRSLKGIKFNINRLSRLHPSMQRLILRLAIAKVKGSTRRLAFQHIREIEDLISLRRLNSIVDLPQKVSVLKKKSNLCIYRRQI